MKFKLSQKKLEGWTMADVLSTESQEGCLGYLDDRINGLFDPCGNPYQRVATFLLELITVSESVWDPEIFQPKTTLSIKILPYRRWNFNERLACKLLDGLSKVIEFYEQRNRMSLQKK